MGCAAGCPLAGCGPRLAPLAVVPQSAKGHQCKATQKESKSEDK
jgi:hypothetical protein